MDNQVNNNNNNQPIEEIPPVDYTDIDIKHLKSVGVSDRAIGEFWAAKIRSKLCRKKYVHNHLTRDQIIEAQLNCRNAATCARYLRVSYDTYKKWAKLFGLWVPLKKGFCKGSFQSPDKGKYPIEEILQNKHPDYPVFRLKDKLIRSGKKEAKCENCGLNEKRVTDGRMPLILNFDDGNPKNRVLENMKLLCYNCTFLIGRGYITAKQRVKNNFIDPEMIQGSLKNVEVRY